MGITSSFDFNEATSPLCHLRATSSSDFTHFYFHLNFPPLPKSINNQQSPPNKTFFQVTKTCPPVCSPLCAHTKNAAKMNIHAHVVRFVCNRKPYRFAMVPSQISYGLISTMRFAKPCRSQQVVQFCFGI